MVNKKSRPSIGSLDLACPLNITIATENNMKVTIAKFL